MKNTVDIKVKAENSNGNSKEAAEVLPLKIVSGRVGLVDFSVFQKLRMAENLAHIIAYQTEELTKIIQDQKKPKNENFLKIYVAEFDCEIKHQIYRFNVNDAGLVGYMLFPIEFPKHHDHRSIEVKIVFKGTDDTPSLYRDLEKSGAGTKSFEENKNHILKQFNEHLGEYKKHLLEQLNIEKIVSIYFNVSIFGHSLGGADAQRMKLALMEAIAKNNEIKNDCAFIESVPPEDRNHFKTIRKMDLYTFNATGISQENGTRGENVALYLYHKKQKGLNLNLTVNIFYADGDGVQQTGETHLLYRVPKELATVELVKARSKYRSYNFMSPKEMIAMNSKLKYFTLAHLVKAGMWLGGGYTAIMSGGALGGAFGTALNWLGWGLGASGTLDYTELAYNGWGLACGIWGTGKSHRLYYFPERPTKEYLSPELKLYFYCYTNKDTGGRERIIEEVQLKSPLANQFMHYAGKVKDYLPFFQKNNKAEDLKIEIEKTSQLFQVADLSGLKKKAIKKVASISAAMNDSKGLSPKGASTPKGLSHSNGVSSTLKKPLKSGSAKPNYSATLPNPLRPSQSQSASMIDKKKKSEKDKTEKATLKKSTQTNSAAGFLPSFSTAASAAGSAASVTPNSNATTAAGLPESPSNSGDSSKEAAWLQRNLKNDCLIM